MKFLTPDMLEPGMELGKSIYGRNGQVLLKKGTIMREKLIASIQKLKFTGVYINDEFSREIEIKDVVNEELRTESVQRLKSLFVTLSNEPDADYLYKDISTLNQLIVDIVDEVLQNKSLNVNLIDLKDHDDYTYQHSVNVSILSTVVGVAMNFQRRQLMNLARGALFHDIGKMFVNKKVLCKPGKLTDEEFDEMKQHSLLGYGYARKILQLSDEALVGIRQHHEKYNGTGYPDARAGKEIHKNSQIIAVADVFDAMTSKRVYHEAILPSEVMEYIMGNVNQHFAPDAVNVFLRKVSAYPLGLGVKLSNGMSGLVCENREGFTMRPKIKLYTDTGSENAYIDLCEKENSAITIVGILR